MNPRSFLNSYSISEELLMTRVQRGRWSTKVNVLKQDRIIYDNEGFAAGFHDGKYKLGKYLVDGFSEGFYKNYEEGYKVGFEEYNSNGIEKGFTRSYSDNEHKLSTREKHTTDIKKKSGGCLSLIICLLCGVGGTIGILSKLF
jgi:hypothetical protein